MFEYPHYERQIYSTLNEILNTTVKNNGDKVCYEFWENRKIASRTFNEVYSDICAFVAFLKKNELIGKHVALIGKTSYEWIIAFWGIVTSGGVAVPIDKELDKDSVLEQLEFADVVAVLYDNAYAEIVDCFKSKTNAVTLGLEGDMIGYINSIECKPAEISNDISPDTPAIISFTSGTSGKSKAVYLSQRNVAASTSCANAAVADPNGTKAMATLPINHMFEIVVSVTCSMYFGSPLCLNDSLRNLKKSMLKFKPTRMVVVPLFIEAFYKEIKEGVKKKHITALFAVMRGISMFLKKLNIDVSRKLFKSVLEQFGGNLATVICGGAFIDESRIKFFDSIGIKIVQGYGITECAPVVAVQTDRASKKGAVGKVLPCCEVKSVDGEIAIKGDNVMLGYYKNPELTNEVLVDGWFFTGDMGRVDDENYLYLTGRKKNLIILSNGENVSPEELELKLQDIEEIAEIVVYGENDKVCAEIYYGEKSDETEKIIRSKISEHIKDWPIYKQIQTIKFRYTEFDKTTTRKIKRGN